VCSPLCDKGVLHRCCVTTSALINCCCYNGSSCSWRSRSQHNLLLFIACACRYRALEPGAGWIVRPHIEPHGELLQPYIL
jgi:hypothetical protein